jgi:hypothetical protein
MKTTTTIATAATCVLAGAGAAPAEEPPTFERDGLPISQLQVQVLGSEGVQEQVQASALTGRGMPASPHQLAVLRHDRRPGRSR